jgi:uncharacterized phage protein gp47/JayE
MADIASLIYIDATGFHYPDYPTLLELLKGDFRTIHGADAYLEADSPDGQWVSIIALAMYDTFQVASAVYNSYSPATAIGDALSRNVKINGISRAIPTHSTVNVDVVGVGGTVITNGIVEDTNGNKWALPATVTIPGGGSNTVTATAVDAGDIRALPGTVTKIATPTRGWQSVTNPTDATPGEAVESDAALRIRQSLSTMIPSLSVMEGIVAAVATVTGVTRYKGYENPTGITDADGIDPHSIAIVVDGGDTVAIAEAIAAKKTPGTGTYADGPGAVTEVVTDQYGIPVAINFMQVVSVPIGVRVTIAPLDNYLSTTADLIKAAVADYINALSIGEDVYRNRLFTPANLLSLPQGATFHVTNIETKVVPGAYGTSDITIDFNEAAACDVADIEIA